MSFVDEPRELGLRLRPRRTEEGVDLVDRKPRGRGSCPDHRSIAAVWPLAGSPAQPGFHRVPNDVEDRGDQMCIRQDPPSDRPIAEQVVGATMPPIGSARMSPVHDLKSFREAPSRCPENQVVVVRHEAPGSKLPPVPHRRPGELALEGRVVVAIPGDRAPIAAAARDVVPAVAVDDPQLARHATTVGGAASRDCRGFLTQLSRLTPGPGSARPAK